MDIFTYIKTKLEDSNLSELSNISEATHIPFSTLINIKYGATDNPRIKTVQPILNYFKKK